MVLERLSRYKRLEQYPEDKELLGDVIVENQQAIEMTSIYRDIINGTRELMSSVINNRLNNVMKYLTSITLVMAIPTIISRYLRYERAVGRYARSQFAIWVCHCVRRYGSDLYHCSAAFEKEEYAVNKI